MIGLVALAAVVLLVGMWLFDRSETSAGCGLELCPGFRDPQEGPQPVFKTEEERQRDYAVAIEHYFTKHKEDYPAIAAFGLDIDNLKEKRLSGLRPKDILDCHEALLQQKLHAVRAARMTPYQQFALAVEACGYRLVDKRPQELVSGELTRDAAQPGLCFFGRRRYVGSSLTRSPRRRSSPHARRTGSSTWSRARFREPQRGCRDLDRQSARHDRATARRRPRARLGRFDRLEQKLDAFLQAHAVVHEAAAAFVEQETKQAERKTPRKV